MGLWEKILGVVLITRTVPRECFPPCEVRGRRERVDARAIAAREVLLVAEVGVVVHFCTLATAAAATSCVRGRNGMQLWPKKPRRSYYLSLLLAGNRVLS